MCKQAIGGNSPGRRTKIKLLLAAWPLFILGTSAVVANEKPSPLPNLTVTANLTPTQLNETGSAVSIITAKQIEQQKVIYVSDILRNVPGLSVSRGGSFGSFTQVRMRGAEGNQTLVRIDGMEVNDPSRGSEFDFGNLLAVDIERIEILRGPQSALYGSDAIGGVINIISKKGKKGLRPTLLAQGGSFDSYRIGGGLSGGIGERFDFNGGASYFSTQGVSSADARNGNGERDGNRNLTAFANANFRPLDNLEFGLTGRLIQSDLDLDGFIGGPGAIDANDKTRSDQYFGRIYARYTLFQDIDWIDWEHIASAAYTENKRDDFTSGNLFSEFDGGKNQYYYQTNLSIDTPDFSDSHHTLTFKLEHEQDKVNASSAFTSVDRRVSTTSEIGEYQLSLFDRLSLSGGIRHDDNINLYPDQTTYRTTISYLLKETGSRLHATWGTGVKNPTLFELFGFTSNFTGNPNLVPEKSNGWDAGITQTFFDDRVSLDVTYFHNIFRDLIVGAGQTAINLNGKTRAEGVEVGLTAKIIEGLDFQGMYTWTSTKDANGVQLVRRPKNLASANLNYGFELFGKNGNLNVGVIYNGKQTDFAFDAFFNRSTVTLDDYTLLNIALSYRVFEELEVFGRVYNALDEKYQEVYSFGTPGVTAYGGFRLSAGPFFD